MSSDAAQWWALVITLALAALHLLAPHIRRLPGVPEARLASFAGGTAVAYVFLHLLPEVAEGNEAIGALLEDVVEPAPLLDLAVFAVALVGFAAFYGLERLSAAHAEHRGGDPGRTTGAFALHVGSFFLYNALITYTMPLRLRTGVAFAVLFSLAMGLHFVLTDRSLEEHYPRRFRTWGRAILPVGLLAGWLAAVASAPTGTVVVSVLTAALAGSILLTVFKDELPQGRRSSYPWFLVGLVGYGALLGVVTALAG